MSSRDRARRAVMRMLWRLMNPIARRTTRIARWWVVLETTGRRSGRPRPTPLARGPVIDGALWLIAVHGHHSLWVRNLEADPRVRVQLAGAWRTGRASAEPYDEAIVARFNLYARTGPATVGIDPCLVRVELG